MRFLIYLLSAATLLMGLCNAIYGQTTEVSIDEVPSVEWSPYELVLKDGSKFDAQLGTIQVPENRKAEQSREIKIRFIKLSSKTETTTAPIFYLAGGPGGAASAAAKTKRLEMFDLLRECGDVILVDQRGTGLSEGLPQWDGQAEFPKNQPRTEALYREVHSDALKKAAEFWKAKGADYRGYTTEQSVADFEAIRRSLGYDKVNLLGISYGTHLALAMLKAHESTINRVVLVSAEGLDQTVKLPSRAVSYFARLQAAIDQDAEARERYPDVAKLMTDVQKKLADGPAENRGVLTPFELQKISSYFVGDPQRIAPLLKAYRDANEGRFGFFKWFLRRPIRIRGMPELMDVASGISDERLKQVRRESIESPLGMGLNYPMPQLRNALPGIDLGDGFRRNPVSSVPALFLSGTLDGRTYPEGHREIAKGFANHAFVTVENGGHNLFFDHVRIVPMIKEFFDEKEIESTNLVSPLPKFLEK